MHTPPLHLFLHRHLGQPKLTGAQEPVESLGDAEVGGERSDAIEGLAADEHRADHRCRPRLVERLRLSVHKLGETSDPTEDHVDLGTVPKHPHAAPDAVGCQQVVRVEQHDGITTHEAHRPAARPADAEVRLGDDADGRSNLEGDGHARIGGSVIDYDHIADRVALSEHAAQCVGDVSRTVVDRERGSDVEWSIVTHGGGAPLNEER